MKKNIVRVLWSLFLLISFLLPVPLHAQVINGGNHPGSMTAQTASVRMSRRRVTLKKNKSRFLKAIQHNTGGRKIVWFSSNSRVVRVSQQGKISGKEGGTAVVTAKVPGTDIEDECIVEVQNYIKMRVRTTGYCNCRRCAGKWAGHATASGKKPRANHTIAVDPRLIKLGSKVQIGSRIYTAEDTGSAIKGRRIDIYYRSHKKASRHGVKYRIAKVFY